MFILIYLISLVLSLAYLGYALTSQNFNKKFGVRTRGDVAIGILFAIIPIVNTFTFLYITWDLLEAPVTKFFEKPLK